MHMHTRIIKGLSQFYRMKTTSMTPLLGLLLIGLTSSVSGYLKSKNIITHYVYPRELWIPVNITCGTEPVMQNVPTGMTPLHWVTPSLSIINKDNSGGEFTLLNNSWVLHIAKFDKAHYGDYMCVLNQNTDYMYRRIQLFKYMPSSDELYQSNIIVGCISAAIAFAVCASLCLIYHFKFDKGSTHPPPPYENGHSNSAFMEEKPRPRIDSADGEAVTQM